MIELIKNNKPNEGYFNIVIDSSFIGDAWAFNPHEEPNHPIQYAAKNSRSSWKLASQTIEDFEPFLVITLNNLFEWMMSGHSIIITPEINDVEGVEELLVMFYFAPTLTFWDNEFSFAEYVNELCRIFEDEFNLDYYDFSLEDTPAFRLELKYPKLPVTIESFLKPLEIELRNVHQITLANLETSLNENKIRLSFEFPEALKISCRQYLEYFAQFLRDLGINATSNLNEEAGKVLFSVTPTDDKEALDKIREALAVYLNLPSSPIVYDESFAALRLKAEIERFHHSQRMTQLELQSTGYALKLAHKSIEDLQIVNQVQKEHIERISSPTIIVDSLENKDEFEKVFEGLEFGESKELRDKLGIKFKPVTAIKTIVRKLSGGDDEIISLKINE